MKKIYKLMLLLGLTLLFVLVIINFIVIISSTYYMDDDINYKNYDYVLVLGAGVRDGRPSKMLKDRLDKVLDIYNYNSDITIIVSGDSVSPLYDETSVMMKYLQEHNVKAENIIIDKYGVSTYDSIVRIKEVVLNKKVIIVTQKYHLYRSVYIAYSNDLDVIGVSCNNNKYFGQIKREVREILARVKDYFFVRFRKRVKYNFPI